MQLSNLRKIFRRASRFVAYHEKVLLAVLAIVIVFSGGFWYRQFNSSHSDVPTVGGTYVEGVIADKKEMSQITTRLTKTGLLSFSETGQLRGQLAEKWSDNGEKNEFRVTLQEGVDRDEIVSVLESRSDVMGNVIVKTDLERDIILQLDQPNPSFPLLLARPLFDYGPYKLGQSNDQTTIFTRNTRKNAVAAYINKIVLHSYSSTDDLQKAMVSGRVDGAVMSRDPGVKNEQHFTVGLRRYYAVLFNTNKAPFRDATLRKQLTIGAPAGSSPFTLTAADQEPYKSLAAELVEKWKAQGASVELSLQPLSDVTGTIGPSRNFQAIVIGIDYGLEMDPYYLWHSSQVRATGNNITGVNNTTIDTMVEKTRATLDPAERQKLLDDLQQKLTDEGIMMILEEENIDYYLSRRIHYIAPALPSSNADRFLSVALWSVR